MAFPISEMITFADIYFFAMKSSEIAALEPKKNILIKGAQIHNLKNLDVVIPRNELVVITGLSGLWKIEPGI